jgi:hypothetical protein
VRLFCAAGSREGGGSCVVSIVGTDAPEIFKHIAVGGGRFLVIVDVVMLVNRCWHELHVGDGIRLSHSFRLHMQLLETLGFTVGRGAAGVGSRTPIVVATQRTLVTRSIAAAECLCVWIM